MDPHLHRLTLAILFFTLLALFMDILQPAAGNYNIRLISSHFFHLFVAVYENVD